MGVEGGGLGAPNGFLPRPQKARSGPENFCTSGSVNSISISGMLSGQLKLKPRWPPIEANFGCQFQSPTQACTSVSVSYATFYSFLKSFLSKYTQNISLKDRNEFKNFKYISTKSNRVTGYIFSQK